MPPHTAGFDHTPPYGPTFATTLSLPPGPCATPPRSSMSSRYTTPSFPAATRSGKLSCADWKLAGNATGPPEPKSPSYEFNCAALLGQNQSRMESVPFWPPVAVFSLITHWPRPSGCELPSAGPAGGVVPLPVMK